MTRLIEILAPGLAKAALATCAFAHRVLKLTGTEPSEMARDYPPNGPMVRHAVPPIE